MTAPAIEGRRRKNRKAVMTGPGRAASEAVTPSLASGPVSGGFPTVKRDADTPVIRLERIRRVYHMGDNEVRALDGLDLTIERGGFWAVMGSSGSGKSTLLNLLGCLDRPTSGRYFLEGEDVSKLDDDALSERRLRHMGFIFQSFNLVPQLTVLENIELPLFYMGVEAEESAGRARDLARLVGLETRLGHRPTELSGGQCQRVAIARALANEPSVILADEPTGNLDSRTGAQIMDLLKELHRQGKTLIIVTHEDHIAESARSQLRLRDGKRVDETGVHGDAPEG